MIVVLTGAPGAGKGTQAELLAKREGFKKLSTGDALRKHVKLATEIGKVAGAIMERGELVSDDILFRMLKEELLSLNPQEVILLDGYPRNIGQAKTLESLQEVHPVKGVVQLEVPRAELIERLSGRRVCNGCAATYHQEENPPLTAGVCDKCGGAVAQRADDRPDVVAVRLDVYLRSTAPVVDFYRAKGLLKDVSGVGELESIYKNLREVIGAL